MIVNEANVTNSAMRSGIYDNEKCNEVRVIPGTSTSSTSHGRDKFEMRVFFQTNRAYTGQEVVVCYGMKF